MPVPAITPGGTGMTEQPELMGADHQQRLAGDGAGANQEASAVHA